MLRLQLSGGRNYVLIFKSRKKQRINHSKDAVERYIRDYEAVKLINSNSDDLNTISLVTRLPKTVVSQYVDLLPADH